MPHLQAPRFCCLIRVNFLLDARRATLYPALTVKGHLPRSRFLSSRLAKRFPAACTLRDNCLRLIGGRGTPRKLRKKQKQRLGPTLHWQVKKRARCQENSGPPEKSCRRVQHDSMHVRQYKLSPRGCRRANAKHPSFWNTLGASDRYNRYTIV